MSNTGQRIEDVVEGARATAGSWFYRAHRDYEALVASLFTDGVSLVVVAGHNTSAIPIDGDSFTYSAASCRRLVQEAARRGKEVRWITDAAAARPDGKLYICVQPLANLVSGLTQEQAATVRRLATEGVASAYLLGDTVCTGAGSMASLFHKTLVLDHHRWPEHLYAVGAGRADMVVINNHSLIPSGAGIHPDAYTAGAFQADIGRIGSDPGMDLLKRVSVMSDMYGAEFPRLFAPIEAAERQTMRRVADFLNFFGTFLYGWAGPQTAKDAALLDVVRTLSEAVDVAALNGSLKRIAAQVFGPEFDKTLEEVLTEVNASIDEFLRSEAAVVFYRMKSQTPTTLLVHKIAYQQLNNRTEFGKRVLVHYQVKGDGSLQVLLGCANDNRGVDVSRVCLRAPGTADGKWGGGHKDRAGFATFQLDAQTSEAVNRWWGAARDPQKVLDYIAADLAEQMSAPKRP